MSGERTETASSEPTCTPVDDWGCEARKKLGIARGVLTDVHITLSGEHSAEDVEGLVYDVQRAIEKTAQPELCRPTALSPDAIDDIEAGRPIVPEDFREMARTFYEALAGRDEDVLLDALARQFWHVSKQRRESARNDAGFKLAQRSNVQGFREGVEAAARVAENDVGKDEWSPRDIAQAIRALVSTPCASAAEPEALLPPKDRAWTPREIERVYGKDLKGGTTMRAAGEKPDPVEPATVMAGTRSDEQQSEGRAGQQGPADEAGYESVDSAIAVPASGSPAHSSRAGSDDEHGGSDG